MNPPTDIETRLRASLTENARHAPPGAALADRILAELDAPVLRPRGGWRTWTFPLLAAAAIAAVAFTLVGIDRGRHTAAPVSPGTHPAPSAYLSLSPSSAPPSPSQPTATSTPVPVTGFRAADVTFVGATDGWALGSEPCISDPTQRCTAILRTTDGTTWRGIGGENFNVSDVKGCRNPCVQHIRFANQTVGYAYGPAALFMTTDGGVHWVQQKGLGADALETLSDNVILARLANTGCPDFCPLLERAPIGTSLWTSFTLPGKPYANISVALARAGHAVILAPIDYNPAKPSGNASTIYRSSNDGAGWSETTSACPSIGAHFTRQVTAATVGTDGTVVVACATTTRSNLVGYGTTAISTNGGRTFRSPPNGGKLPPAELIAAADNGVQLVVARGTMYRSTDSGNSWTRVPQLHDVTFVGFEDGHDGRAVGDAGQTVWVTHDAGATWSGGPFSP